MNTTMLESLPDRPMPVESPTFFTLRATAGQRKEVIMKYVKNKFAYRHVGKSGADDLTACYLLVAVTMLVHDWPIWQICPRWHPFDGTEPENCILEAWEIIHSSLQPTKSKFKRRRLIQGQDLAQLLVILASWYYDIDTLNGLWGTRDILNNTMWEQIADPNFINDVGLPVNMLDSMARCFIVRRQPVENLNELEGSCTSADLNNMLQKRQELRQFFGKDYEDPFSRGQRASFFKYIPLQLEWMYWDQTNFDRKYSQIEYLPLPGCTLRDSGPAIFHPYRNVEVGSVMLQSDRGSKIRVTRYWCKGDPATPVRKRSKKQGREERRVNFAEIREPGVPPKITGGRPG